MDALHSTAPGEYEYAGETQGATQQASQVFFGNDIHPMERPFFGCLQPCNTALRRIDFLKAKPIISLGRGQTNDFVLPGMRISYNHCQIDWDGREDSQSQVVVHDNSTNGTWINGSRVIRGQSRILRDGNEIAFGSPAQQQNAQEDYRFIYRHLAPLELTGIHAYYDMAHELGRGTFATVMKAMARTTGEWWAVKIIHSQKLRGANATNNTNNNNNNNAAVRNNSGQLQNLAREISILETLDHANICRLRETFVPDDGSNDFYLVLEFVEGGDLLDYILTNGGLKEPMAQHITSQMCSALSYIHKKGIAHRDLKPENVLLTKDDPPIVKVADFGLAKVVDSLTMLRTMCGTPNYLAPEVVMDGVRVRGYDHLVDSWSVGVIVFSMLTNAGPFLEDEHEPDVARRIAGRSIQWNILQELGVSTTAQDFIRRLLDADPNSRMSLTDALSHPWLSPAVASGSGSTQSSTMQPGLQRSMSEVSALSALPEDGEGLDIDGDAPMFSAAPSSDDVLGVHNLRIKSPAQARTRPPLERRSKVLARELEAEAEANAAAASSPRGSTGKRQRSENGGRASGSGSPVDAAMGGESGDSDPARMEEEEPRPRATKRGRRGGNRASASSSPPTAIGGGNDNGAGRVLRSRVAPSAGGPRR